MIVAREDRKFRIAWLECTCCEEQGPPMVEHSAAELRTDNAECYRCVDDDCECLRDDACRATLTALAQEV